MRLSEVRQNIARWNDLKNTDAGTYLKAALGFQFQFAGDQFTGDGSNIHAYPAVDASNNFLFYLIDASFDTASEDTLDSYIVEGMVSPMGLPAIAPDTPISKATANNLVDNWNNDTNRNAWLSESTSNRTLYFVLRIPGNDIVAGKTYTALFGLQVDSADGTTFYQADLVLVDDSGHITIAKSPDSSNTVQRDVTVLYSDTVMPVPPHQPQRYEQFRLYTLSAV